MHPSPQPMGSGRSHGRVVKTSLPALAVTLALTVTACDPPAVPAQRATVDAARSPSQALTDGGRGNRTVVRKTLTYYHWLVTDPPSATGDGQGLDHGCIALTLVVEVHKTPRGEGWVELGALGPQVFIPENLHLRGEGASVAWHLPAEGHNDPRTEILGGEIRTEEPIRAYLAAHPESTVDVTPGAAPSMVRLPVVGNLAVSPRASAGQFDAMLVVLVPVHTRRGGRYLLQVLDLLAEPGGFSANGVMAHAPSRAEMDRFTRWMRDPQGMNRDRNPPLAVTPIDRN